MGIGAVFAGDKVYPQMVSSAGQCRRNDVATEFSTQKRRLIGSIPDLNIVSCTVVSQVINL